MSRYTIGNKVVIVKDCREEEMATGQIGILEAGTYMPSLAWPNPRIRLQDGSVIWGCECWWASVENAPQMQENLEKQKALLRGVFPAVGD